MRQIRPKTNGYSNVGRLEALEKRRREARERQAARDGRSDAEQIYLLNRRPGNAARERARIAARYEAWMKENA